VIEYAGAITQYLLPEVEMVPIKAELFRISATD
jgi:hypothetical protein